MKRIRAIKALLRDYFVFQMHWQKDTPMPIVTNFGNSHSRSIKIKIMVACEIIFIQPLGVAPDATGKKKPQPPEEIGVLCNSP